MDCDLAVGEVGDDYLVYADPSISSNPAYELPEVTFFNRTSRLLPSRKAEMIVMKGFSVTYITENPPVNRADASGDIDVLLALRECGCLIAPSSSAPIEASAEETERVAACMVCFRRSLKPFYSTGRPRY
jgi:hypothetical protein